MKPIVTLALLLLLVLIFWFARCRPGAGGANCLDNLTELPLSGDYCDPQLVSLDYESGSYEAPADAPQSACAQTGLGDPIWLRVRAPRSGQLVLHQYLDEPLTTAIEVFAGSCADGFRSVDCREMTGIISSDTFKVSGSGTLLVRVQPLRRVRSTARAGSRLSLAAIDGRTNAQPCDTTRNDDRLIISSSRPPGEVRDLLENELGLPLAAVCECSPDKTLIAISVPPGIDLETVVEKSIRKRPIRIRSTTISISAKYAARWKNATAC